MPPEPIRAPADRQSTVTIEFDLDSVDSYRTFLQVKSLPRFEIRGRTAEIPSEYAHLIGRPVPRSADSEYVPILGLFDYQRDIARLAIRRRKFAVFADPGLGKTLILTEFARHAARHIPDGRCILIVSPLMVISQTLGEVRKFYGETLPIERIPASGLGRWLVAGESRIGITNYEALNAEVDPGRLAGLCLDESSYLKSHYGKWGTECIRLGRGLDWKLALTGTPAPNDRIEYANHAVFLDAFPTVNSFLARFFVNRGQTGERWELKPHALRPFYRALAHWSIFLTDPATYGWKDNVGNIPPIRIHHHEVPLTDDQEAIARGLTGTLFANELGGITGRSTFGQLAKGRHAGRDVPTAKPAFIRSLADSWPDESAIIWCIYNHEQELMERTFPGAASLKGSTSHEERARQIEDFQAGRIRIVISKSKVMGFGLNLQVATRMVFSGLQDSLEMFYQCIKRANRVGSRKPLDVHIPATDLEYPMIANVMRKLRMIERDTREQEQLFQEVGHEFLAL